MGHLTVTSILGQSGPRSKGNERILCTLQIFTTAASPSDVV